MGDIEKFSFYLYESTLENTDPNITRKKEILENILIVKLLNLDADERIKGSWWVRFTFKVSHYCGASLIDIVKIVSSICTYLVKLNDEENIERYWRITNDTIEQVVHDDYFTDAATRLSQDISRNQGILLPFQVSSLGACNFGHRQAPSTLHGTKAPTEGTTLCGVAVKFPFQATPDTRAHALEQLQKHYRHARFSAGPIEMLQRAKHNTSVLALINRKIKHCLWFCWACYITLLLFNFPTSIEKIFLFSIENVSNGLKKPSVPNKTQLSKTVGWVCRAIFRITWNLEAQRSL